MKTYTVDIYDNGSKYWYLNGECHREDGPAIELANGNKCWFFNGKRHREDGPAIEWSDGSKFWYLNDVKLTQEEFNAKMNPNTCNGRIVVIDGKSYKLQEVK